MFLGFLLLQSLDQQLSILALSLHKLVHILVSMHKLLHAVDPVIVPKDTVEGSPTIGAFMFLYERGGVLQLWH